MEYIYTDKDGNQIKYTDDMVRNAIDERNEYKTRYEDKCDSYDKVWNEKYDIRRKVYGFFKDRYDTGDTEIVCTVDDVNELLIEIGADRLKALFTVEGTISFIITDIEAESEDDARDMVESDLRFEYDNEGSLHNWDCDIREVSQQ